MLTKMLENVFGGKTCKGAIMFIKSLGPDPIWLLFIMNLESKKSRNLTGPWMELHGVSKSFPREVSLVCLCDLVFAHWILDFGRKYIK